MTTNGINSACFISQISVMSIIIQKMDTCVPMICILLSFDEPYPYMCICIDRHLNDKCSNL